MKYTIILLLMSFNALANEAMVSLGEIIFNDVRFSKHFYNGSNGNVNMPIEQIKEPEKLVSCASCHRIDQDLETLGMRGYNDFESRTALKIPLPNMSHSLRNTTSLMGIGSQYSRHDIAHYDGEVMHHETYLGNFTGPHHGWSKSEVGLAQSNFIKVVRQDSQAGSGLGYDTLFLGVDPAIPNDLRLPPESRVNIETLSDDELIDYIASIGMAYLKSIDFQTDETGEYIGSGYDKFLKLNNISRGPKEGESIFQYSRDLLLALKGLKKPKFVISDFEEQQWRGLKVFFNINAGVNSGRGMCVQCHTPPLFTDQSFHNVAVTQKEYDLKNGNGAFFQIQKKLPTLELRNSSDFYSLDGADLGVWNFFARDGKDVLTNFIHQDFCSSGGCSSEELLPLMLARFKTPSLRNLSFSDPYFHNGSSKSLKSVLKHYQEMSTLVRKAQVVNPAPQMRALMINEKDIADLEAFLKSLDEDYE